jgi:Dolichyl-phosphate-mannose-protein mannosyltransferase
VALATATSKQRSHSLRARLGPVPFTLILFSLFYFLDVSLRASEKFFWYDELFTVYFARLPDLRSLWAALNRGVDFNPPLFYLLTRACNFLFGEGTIATRLPEILGFWIFSLCLFRFVSRRAGALAGFSAMLFPMLTGAYYYAYEARPHAIVLGACGLALVCWQMTAETFQPRRRWLSGLSFSLLFAFMLHCYALTLLAPFTLAELAQTLRLRRVKWRAWLAIFLPALLSLPLYIPLLRSYKELNTGNAFTKIAVPEWTHIAHFYLFLFEPCILVVFGTLVLFALDIFGRGRTIASDNVEASRALPDLILGLAFLTLPAFGVALGKLVNGPFFSRYFLAALAGVCILVGIGAGFRNGRKWIPLVLTFVLICGATINLSKLISLRLHGRGEWLEESSMHFALNTTPGQPLDMYPLLTSLRTNSPIAILNPLDFIYLVHYDPGLKDQLYFATASRADFTFFGFQRFRECAHIDFQTPLTFSDIAKAKTPFWVYGDTGNFDQIAVFGEVGVHIKSIVVNKSHFLARLEDSSH